MCKISEVGVKSFKPGEAVTVTRRFTVTLQLSDKTEHRRDINEGTKGIIKGYADENHRQVLIEMSLKVPLKQSSKKTDIKTFVEKTFPRNLERTSVYEERTKDEALSKATDTLEVPPAIEETTVAVAKGFEWLSEHPSVSDPQAEIRVESQWDKYSSDQDDVARIWALKGKVSMGLWNLYESLPKFTPNDLVVCHRQNIKGAWKTEVWTNRDFQPRELMIGAISTDLRDRMWSQSASVIIGIPQQGPSRHPEGKNMAIDGRNKHVLAASKSIDDAEHRGGIFWAIQRTGDITQEHNLILENVTWEASVSFKLPGGKKRKVDMDWKDLPQLPVIMNPKKINAHTPLVLYQDLQTLQKNASKGEAQH